MLSCIQSKILEVHRTDWSSESLRIEKQSAQKQKSISAALKDRVKIKRLEVVWQWNSAAEGSAAEFRGRLGECKHWFKSQL